MFCRKCGYENLPDAVYCSGCGCRMEPEKKKKRRKKKKNGLIVAVTAVAVLVVAVAAAVLLVPRDSKESPAAGGGGTAQMLAMPTVPSRGTVSAGYAYSVYLRPDGTLTATPHAPGYDTILGWTDLVAVDTGNAHVVGLKSNGTVVTTKAGDAAAGWSGIVAVSAEGSTTLGLKADGTVLASGENTCGECDVTDWQNIVAVCAGRNHSVGVKADGTVVAAGDNTYGQCDVSGWTDIVAVSTEMNFTVGLKSDGTVVVAGKTTYEDVGQMLGALDVSGWTDVTAIATGIDNIYALKADGTLLCYSATEYYCGAFGQFGAASDWTNIVDISASDHLVAIKADGSIVAMGGNQFGECDPCRLQPETAEHFYDGGVCMVCGYAQPGYKATQAACDHRFQDTLLDDGSRLSSVCMDCGLEQEYSLTPMTSFPYIDDTNESGSTSDIGMGDWKTTLGTVAEDSLKFWVVDRAGYVNTEYIEFDIGGGYEVMAGWIYAGEDTEAGADMKIRIYLDGVLEYEFEDITYDANEVFSINVGRETTTVRIECVTYSSAFGHCIVDAGLGR